MKRFLIIFLALSTFYFKGTPALWAQDHNTLSDLSFLDTNGERYTSKDIPDHSALLIVYFRTDCDECRHMAQEIKVNADKYPLMIWLVSPNETEELNVFEYMMGLMDLENVKVLRDYRDIMHKTFSFSYLPFCILFDGNGRQITTFDYFPKPETVIKALSKK